MEDATSLKIHGKQHEPVSPACDKAHKRCWSRGINRNFTEDTLKRFFSVIKNPRHKLCFQLQAYLGLRISEAVKVNLEDVNLEAGFLRVHSAKTGRTDQLPLRGPIAPILEKYIKRFRRKIKSHGGFLVYSDQKTEGYITKDTMRVKFAKYRSRAGLDQGYADVKVTGGQKGRKEGFRRLYVLSTHSLRHYFITEIYKKTKDVATTQALARHVNFNVTRDYVNISATDLEKAMEKTFSKEDTIDDMDEFLEFFLAWKAYKKMKNKK